jgi:hypothetical protein
MLIPDKFVSADIEDKEFQKEFNDWLNGLWKEKDKLIDAHLEKR